MGTKNMKLDSKDDENPNLQLEISASEVQKSYMTRKGEVHKHISDSRI